MSAWSAIGTGFGVRRILRTQKITYGPQGPATEQLSTYSDLGFYLGAGDGNRTRTISLGS